MASFEQHCDTMDDQEDEKAKQKQGDKVNNISNYISKMTTSTLIFVCIPVSTGVHVYLNAQTGSTVDAPVLVGNTIESLTVNYIDGNGTSTIQ